MFWGINLKPNCKYSQTASKSFHISQAALNTDTCEDGSNQLYISCENQKILVCTLRKNFCEQVMLDLNFAEGNEICFQSIGSGSLSLSGYLIDEPNPFEDDDASDLDSEASEIEYNEKDLRNALNLKSQQKKVRAAAKAAAVANAGELDEDEDDEDDSDFNGDTSALNDEDDSDGEEEESDDGEGNEDEDDEEDDDDEDEEEEEDESDEEIVEPKAKQAKLEKKQQPKQAQQNGVAKPNANGEKKSKKEQKKQKPEQQKQQQKQPQQNNNAGGERVITGGVKVEDVRVGNGTEAKSGKRVQVYYEGRLKSNNKVFDSMKQGAGFKFGIGRGEVIKGWEVGVAGMKVGGKRRITCPPHMAYGARGYPPSIPPNSTLVFDIELKGVN